MHWRRKWQPTPVFFPVESHGRRSLVGYSPWGCKELVTTERLHSLHSQHVTYVIMYFVFFQLKHLRTVYIMLLLFSSMSDSMTSWTIAHQASLSLHCLPEFAQTYVHWINDASQPSHPLLPRLVSTSLFPTSVSLFLPCKLVHHCKFSWFHIYALLLLLLLSRFSRVRLCATP